MKRVVFTDNYDKSIDELLVIELGITYKEIRQLLDKVRKDGNFHFRGFGDMCVEEVAKETGLDMGFAKLAKQREYDGTLKFDVSGEEVMCQSLQSYLPLWRRLGHHLEFPISFPGSATAMEREG